MTQNLFVSIGSSDRPEARRAGQEAAQQAAAGLAGPARLALVFGSSWFHQEQLLQGVRAVAREVPLIGGSTAGEILPEGPVSHTCVVILMASDSLRCGIGAGRDVHLQPREAGHQAALSAAQELRDASRTGFLLIGDGLSTGYGQVTRGIQDVLGTSAVIAGGMAGDDLRFTKTYQYCNGQVLERAVVGALFGGVTWGVGIAHGFAPISKPRCATRAAANVLYELDTLPAAAVYEDYFGPVAARRLREEGLTRSGSAYPLGIRSESADYWLLRNVLALQADGSLLCSGEIPEGASLQLMIGSKQLAMDAAAAAARQAVEPMEHPAFALLLESASRLKLLGREQAAMEIARIRQVIGRDVPIAGCYTYGEQAPLAAGTSGAMAVQTGSVLVLVFGGS